jgi:integrase
MGISISWRKAREQWEVTARHRGKKKVRLAPKGVGKREAEATIGPELLAELVAQVEAAEIEATQLPTLWAFCADVYSKHHGVSALTWERERKYKVAGIMEDLGDLRLDQITTGVVTHWIERLQREGAPRTRGGRGKPLGTEAANDYLVALRGIYKVAKARGVVDRTPFNNTPASVDLTTDRKPWTKAMMSRLVEVCDEDDPLMGRLARFLMLTGCRPIEALRLEWAHVQRVPGPPRVRLTGKGKVRALPIGSGALGDLFTELEAHKAEWDEAVFAVENGATMGQRFRYWPQRRWERVCAIAEVPSVAYDLRHSFITEQVARGVPLAQVAWWCGNSVRVIEARYAHLQPDHLSMIADGLEAVSGAPPMRVVKGG